MLSKNPEDRPTAEQILASPWIEHSMKKSGGGGNVEIGSQILQNLKNFHVSKKLLSFKIS